MSWLTVRTGDGRDLEVLSYGAEGGPALVYHCGTPSGAAPFPLLERAAAVQGHRVVTISRPGYGRSTRQPGRAVSAVAADVTAVLDHLGLGEFVALGWSGGGPHALACAALLPGRCTAAATIAGVAPYRAEGVDFLAGMGPENVEEFGAAIDDHERLRAFLEAGAAEVANVTGAEVAASLGGLVPEVDRAALTGDLADHLAASFRQAVSSGIWGWYDDDLAFVSPWGFSVEEVGVPVAVWQGGQDLMVPFAHGQWLAAHIPTARPRLFPEEGHISVAGQMERIVADLVALGA